MERYNPQAIEQRMLVPPKLVLNFKPIAAIKEKLNLEVRVYVGCLEDERLRFLP